MAKRDPIIRDEDKALAALSAKGIPESKPPESGLVKMLTNVGIAGISTQGRDITANLGPSDVVRGDFLKYLLDGPRDIDSECGYPPVLTPALYMGMYDREGIAARVVQCEPEESWAIDPKVYEDEDETTETEFEKAFDDLCTTKNIFHYLLRIDVLSGIGQYGILLLGINDGKNLAEPVDGYNDDGTYDEGNDYELMYIRPFSEVVTFVKTREMDVTNPRYGLPTRYTIQFRDFPNWGIQMGEIIARDIHWTRVIHVADNLKESPIYGEPRQKNVWNRLYDLRKIYASSGEAFWKGAFPAIAFEVNPEIADQGIALDKDELRKEMEHFSMNLQRYFAIVGMTAKSIPPMVVDPTGTVETHLKAIAISKGIPYRTLFGSEEAKLAGNSDTRQWNKRISKRQRMYLTPMLIRPFIDRMIAYGVLPKPETYIVEWDDLNTPTDIDKAQVGLVKSQAMAQYVQSGASQLMAPMEFLTLILGLSTEEAQLVMEGVQGSESELSPGEDTGEQDNQLGEGSLGGAQNPDQGNALDMKNLGGETTIPPGGGRGGKGKRVDSTFTEMPNLNKRNGKGREVGAVVNELLGNFVKAHGKKNGKPVNGKKR